MGDVKQRLHPISFISCGPTAVGAVTGQPEAMVVSAMKSAAAEDGEYPARLVDSDFRHQARAVELLGSELYDLNGHKMDARSISSVVKLGQAEFHAQPTIDQFVRDNQHDDVLLCQAYSLARNESHTFAVDHGSFFDNNTGEKIVASDNIPPAIAEFRVIRVIAVRAVTPVDDSGGGG
jgi:hypothetical protein